MASMRVPPATPVRLCRWRSRWWRWWWSPWWRWSRRREALGQRARARTAADAAALAGAAEGEDAARRLAAANGGEVVLRSPVRGDEVVVRVRVGDVEAEARARGGAPPLPPPVVAGAGRGGRAGLAPEMTAALARADALLGRPVPVVSGLRTYEQQRALWDRRASNPYPVARPGTSDHERGLAVDVSPGVGSAALAVAAAAGCASRCRSATRCTSWRDRLSRSPSADWRTGCRRLLPMPAETSGVTTDAEDKGTSALRARRPRSPTPGVRCRPPR